MRKYNLYFVWKLNQKGFCYRNYTKLYMIETISKCCCFVFCVFLAEVFNSMFILCVFQSYLCCSSYCGLFAGHLVIITLQPFAISHSMPRSFPTKSFRSACPQQFTNNIPATLNLQTCAWGYLTALETHKT